MRPAVRDLPLVALVQPLRDAGVRAPEALARRLALAVHRQRALTWEESGLGVRRRADAARCFELTPLLSVTEVVHADDGTRKMLFRTHDGHAFETVVILNREQVTLCLSSQAGCALGCTFCATGTLGLMRNLTAGEITESLHRSEREANVRVTDLVFMGQGEPLQNFNAVMTACQNANHDLGGCISRKKISISTSGLTPQIHRFVDERQPWRLYLSLHAADQRVRESIMPIAHRHPLPNLVAAMRRYQLELRAPWVTLQYVAIPGVNMDDAAVEAIQHNLGDLRYILNVIPYNDVDAGYRPPTWAEVKTFTEKLRALGCPVKTRYSAGKRDGMGCGQLAAQSGGQTRRGGHLDAPPGTFSDLAHES